jgi:hypothetical protein
MKTVLAAMVVFGSQFQFCDATQPVPDATLYKVTVDSVQIPASASVGDTVSVRFFGTIAADGCSSFSRFEDSISSQSVDLIVWAKREASAVCPAVMVYLDGRIYRFIPEEASQVTITVHQPDGSVLQRTLLVQ